MKRKKDIQELLDEVEFNLDRIKKIYENAQKSEDILIVARPKVKSCLDHLRSALDYLAHDLSDETNSAKTPKNVYFPYGKNKKNFMSSLNKNLPELEEKFVAFLETVQPFSCGDQWLINLCQLNNFNKHVELKDQTRVNSQESITHVGNLVRMDSTSTVVFGKNSRINGIPITKGEDLIITGDKSIAQIHEELNISMNIKRNYKWVKFIIKDTGVDILSLIEKSHNEIRKLTDLIYT
ncbi:MAG: hypothetical protein GC158_12820 [Cyanobacteria bacterium RI_101]|nr:hypothetical protein [Cyanobacteria bacterium RI_101]